jgi:DNA-binding MarR family transcriptional regulator
MLEVSSRSPVPSAWVRLLQVHAALVERMDRRLRAEHGLSLREYEVLLALSEERLRRVDLARRVLLTQSGVTRILEKLMRDGLVEAAAGEADRRVSYAALTAAGRNRFLAAARTHRADIAEQFTAHLGERDLAALDRVLRKLPGGDADGAWRAPAPPSR